MYSLIHFGLVLAMTILVSAQPHYPKHHHHKRELVEGIIEVEEIVEVWATTTVASPKPSGWNADIMEPQTKESTTTRWTTIQSEAAAASSPLNHIHKGGAKIGIAEHKVDVASPTSTKAFVASSSTDAGFGFQSPVAGLKAAPSAPHATPSKPSGNGFNGHSSSTVLIVSNTPPSSSTPALGEASTSSNAKPALSQTSSSSVPVQSVSSQQTGRYPFSALVAFGDNLSDNGNGSYAHHVADQNNPYNAIYGARTWTNAQVAVSYLTDLLGVPMTQNFAFGHAWGGSDAGATLDNTMYVSDFHNATVAAELGCLGAPPASQQVSTYISQGVNKEALHFLWIGNNDADMVGFYHQDDFNKNLTDGFTKVVKQLLDAEAPYIVVPNIYPKQFAPVVPKWYGWTTAAQQADFGTFINNANSILKKTLDSLNSDKVIYYDANAFLTNVWNNAGNYNITNSRDTNGWPAFCDGDPDQTQEVKDAIAAGTINPKDRNNWGICVDDSKQDEWYWMQYLDPTSRVHELLAGDMNRAIASHFGQTS